MGDKQSKKDLMIQKLAERQGEAKTVRKIVIISMISIFALILILGLSGFLYVKSALQPVDEDSKEYRKVEIPMGSSTTTISNILEKNEIIKDARVFKYYVKFRNESQFQAGNYELSQSMTFNEIIETIKTGKLVQEAVFKITIPEGYQLKQIAATIAEKTNRNEDEVFKTLTSEEFVEKMMTQFPDLLSDEILGGNVKYSLEGYLYPATYEFYQENPSLESIVSDMLTQTNKIIAKYEDALTEKNMSVHKLLTFASLIEEEASQKADRSKIASVFYNRLEKGMKLQTDPTVAYAMGKHLERTFYSDLEYQDPYNTYYVNGLPPGPISNSGESSIVAVLEPAKTDFEYFIATKTGEVLFSRTLDEHEKLVAEHITNQ